MAGNTEHLIISSKQHPTLAASELRHTCEHFRNLKPHLFITSRPRPLNHYGYARLAAQLLLRTTPDNLRGAAQLIKSPYRIHLHSEDGVFASEKELADRLYEHVLDAQVDLHDPLHEYLFMTVDGELFVGEIIERNTDLSRRAHDRTRRHPTTLDPKIAKALLCIAGGKNVHDPFCGVGGIVMEGLRQGLKITGSDIQATLVAAANENCGSDVCFVSDATKLQRAADAYVCDLPYGKSSRLSTEKETLFKGFFRQASKNTRTVVAGCDASIPLEVVAEGWVLDEKHEIYAHKTLTRMFYRFTKAPTKAL